MLIYANKCINSELLTVCLPILPVLYYIFKHYRPLSPREIKNRALSKIGPIPYSILWSNCEHFAAWCRNDTDWSEQVGLQQSMCQFVVM